MCKQGGVKSCRARMEGTSLLVAAKQEETNEKSGQFWSLKKQSGDQDPTGELKQHPTHIWKEQKKDGGDALWQHQAASDPMLLILNRLGMFMGC